MVAALIDSHHEYDRLGTVYLWIAGGVFAIIALGFAFMLIRYRAGRDPDRAPGTKHKNTVAEVSYMVVLVFITAFLVLITFNTLSSEDSLLAKAADARHRLEIDVVGAQWNWRFTYAGTPKVVIDPPPRAAPTPLYVPQGRPILFTGRSQDVLHQFWVPAVDFKRQIWPDHTERWGMVFPTRGTFTGVCNWFCGLYHQNMRFVVHVLAPGQFDTWLAGQRRKASAT